MPWSGAGVFVELVPPDFPAVSGQVITASYFNAVIRDLVAGINAALAKNGENAATGNVTLGANLSVSGNTTLGNASGDTLTVTGNTVTWANDPTHSGNHTFSGNVTLQGNTTLGNASGDTLTIASNAITWSNNPTHSGNHTFSSNVTISGTTALASASTVGGKTIGYRGIPRRTSGWADGECLSTDQNQTLNTSDMAAGYCFSIYNSAAGSITLTAGGGVTIYDGTDGTSAATYTLGPKSMTTLWCDSGTVAVIGGTKVT